MDENKSFTPCNNSSNNVNENFRTLEIHERSSDSNPKRDSSICDNIQDDSVESTAFPVNLKEVFELTSPSSEVNQTLLRQTNNVEPTVGSYQLSQLNPSMKYDEPKQVLWQDDLPKSLNSGMRSSPNCDPFLVKPVSCERLAPIANPSWSHAFRDPDNEQDKLTSQNAINLSGSGERRTFRNTPHLNLLSDNHNDNDLGNQRTWAESLHQTSAHKRSNVVIVNDVPFHDFSLSRMHPSLEAQQITNEKNKCWSTELSTKPWYPTTEQSIKYMHSNESKKTPSLTPKKDASCQVDDIPYQSTLEESLVPSEKSTKRANSDGPLPSAVQNESQSLSQVPASLENNIIKPELYTQERNLCVAVGAKPYGKHPRSDLYPCSQCGKAFGDNRSLHRHLIVHSGMRSFHCPECNKSFMLKGDLTRHVRIHSGEKPYVCEICHRRFTLKGNLMQHFRTHSAEKQYACTLCSKNYAQKDSLHRHIRAHFGDKPFQCDHCGKRFTLKGDLSRHTLIHSGIKPHVCKYCGRSFSLKGNLRQHIRVHTKLKNDYLPALSKAHNEQRLTRDSTYSHTQKKQMLQNNISPMFKLPPEVGNVIENLSAPLENGHHVNDYNSVSDNSDNHQIQTIELAFCSACSRTFPSPESLQKHVQLIHEQSTRLSNKRYLCNVCKKEFSLKGDITRHLNSHNGIKPYQCEQCDKTFTLKSNLRQHLTTHVLSKSFDCPLCSKPFGNRRNLSLHLKRHDQASANFMCTKCGRSFLAKSDHFFHNCSKDDDADSSSQVPLNCSLNSTTMCSSSSSSSPPTITTTHYTIPSEAKLDAPQSSGNSDINMIKKELFLPLPCNERELNTSNPENHSQNSHASETFFNPFYRHLYFATSNQTTMPNLRGLLHSSSELTADVLKMTKAN